MHCPLGPLWVAAFAMPIAPLTARALQGAPSIRSETTTVRSYDGRSLSAEFIRLTVPERRSNLPGVRDVMMEWRNGVEVRKRSVGAALPKFATVAEALQAAPQRGRP